MRVTIVLFVMLVLLSCSGDTAEKKKKGKKEITKDGVNKTYYSDGKLRATVPIKNGKRNGLAVEYYNNGKKHLEINYVDGKNHGLTTRYYENGNLYEQTPYENGEMHGLRKRYRKDGKLSAEAPYYKGNPCTGLKEFLVDGRLKKNYPTIVIQPIDRILQDDRYMLRLSLSDKSTNVTFYTGKLENNCIGYAMREVPPTSVRGASELEFYLPQGMFVMEEIPIIAKVKTPLGNYYITQKKHNLAIENR